jgi:hypothetical protein
MKVVTKKEGEELAAEFSVPFYETRCGSDHFAPFVPFHPYLLVGILPDAISIVRNKTSMLTMDFCTLHVT